MDTVTLVDGQIDDGQRLLDRLREEGVDVRAAGWLKPVETDRWSLYIATPVVDERGSTEAYRQVLGALRSLGSDWIDSSDVWLVGTKHPAARDLLDIRQRSPDWVPARSRHPLLGGTSAEEVYVYPSAKPVEVTVYGLAYRGDPSHSLHLSFEPPNPKSWLVVEAEGKSHKYPAETGIDWVVAAPAGATLGREGGGPLMLTWNLRGNPVRSDAKEVWSFAKCDLHGFSFLREPAHPGW